MGCKLTWASANGNGSWKNTTMCHDADISRPLQKRLSRSDLPGGRLSIGVRLFLETSKAQYCYSSFTRDIPWERFC